MKNKGIIILCIILSIVGLTAFGFSNNQVSENPIKDKTEIDSNTVNKGLPYFGIKIDYRTGKETKIAPSKPDLSYMVVRGSGIKIKSCGVKINKA